MIHVVGKSIKLSASGKLTSRDLSEYESLYAANSSLTESSD